MESIGICDYCKKDNQVLFTDKNQFNPNVKNRNDGYYCRECSDIVGIDTT